MTSVATSDTLAELIARLEKATGPDRGLDGDIAWAVGGPGIERHGLASGGWISKGPHHAVIAAPPYTASIDAALTLVPKVCNWTVDGFPDGSACASVYEARNDGMASGLHDGATPAIALCIVALRARRAIGGAS